MPSCTWHYIRSVWNPADCVSRGLLPSTLLTSTLYWDGPPFLQKPISEWPEMLVEQYPTTILPDVKAKPGPLMCATATVQDCPEWFSRFSSLSRLQRVTAIMIRFSHKTRQIPTRDGPLSRDELNQALDPIIRSTQERHFNDLLRTLRSKNSKISPRSMAQLAPFFDEKGIIRVGGRIRNSMAPFAAQCPILLPKASTLTTLLIRHFHLTYLHAGPQLMLSLIRRQYWILSGRSTVRQTMLKCVTCARHRATAPQPRMSELPSQRVRASRPFSHVGCDFAGPLLIKDGHRRNARSIKCYLAIFVCMATKAAHIEVVSDLSTDAFIASLHRFVSRRGIPVNIYSDCGKNFKGADRQLQSLFADQTLVTHAIPCKWNFNPPAAPHFGGLWEATVKSTKYHLRRVIGTQLLTFEEMTTLASRIEAILNSRPLTATSSDPNDLLSLTPGDFLIGQPLVAIPEPDLTSVTLNRLTRWQLLRQMYQAFWKRWSNEYVTSLQSRGKWIHHQPNVKLGDLVVIHVPKQSPTHWKLGRIEMTHPGEDGIVRVATVRTADGITKRPVVKLAVLPVDPQRSDS